jgi:PAS domain-containing protein
MPSRSELIQEFLPRSSTALAATVAAAATLLALAWIDSQPRVALAVPASLWLLAHASVVLTLLVLVRGTLLRERAAPVSGTGGEGASGALAQVADGADDSLGHAALNELGDVVFTIDSAGCWAYLNPAWERLSGIPVVEAIGRPFLQSLHQDDRPRVQEHFDALLRGATAHGGRALCLCRDPRAAQHCGVRREQCARRDLGCEPALGGRGDAAPEAPPAQHPAQQPAGHGVPLPDRA